MEIALWVEDRGFFEWGGGGRGVASRRPYL